MFFDAESALEALGKANIEIFSDIYPVMKSHTDNGTNKTEYFFRRITGKEIPEPLRNAMNYIDPIHNKLI